MRSIDQLGNELHWKAAPRRIVSLVPSITELLCDLGLEDRLLGCTKFCVHPSDLRKSKTIVGGTKNIQLDRIQQLQPELIIANKEENRKADIERLQSLFPCWVSEIKNLEDAAQMTRKLAAIFAKEETAEALLAKNRKALPQETPPNKGTALYLIWQQPYMSVGQDTYIHDMLLRCGFTNCCGDLTRYPSLTEATIRAMAPQHILLSSEPFPFKEQHIAAIQAISPTSNVQLVDGEYFSWYGSRLGNIGPLYKAY